jgi:hypothetical protein
VIVPGALIVGIQVSPKPRDADAAKYAEHVPLVLVEFRGRLAAVGEEGVLEEGLYACETEVGEARAVV